MRSNWSVYPFEKDYVLEQRIEKAKQFLSQTSLRISEIAERVGYMDIAYFSNTYKRITGETPTEYRMRLSQL